jgi:hypothetical protein
VDLADLLGDHLIAVGALGLASEKNDLGDLGVGIADELDRSALSTFVSPLIRVCVES